MMMASAPSTPAAHNNARCPGENARRGGGGRCPPGRGRAPVGGSALLAAGLAERRLHTGDTRYDDLLRRLGRFMASQTEPSGAVVLGGAVVVVVGGVPAITLAAVA